MNYSRVLAVIQARTGSSRLPGKVLAPIWGSDSILDIVIKKAVRTVGRLNVVVATTELDADEPIARIAHHHNVGVSRGSVNDVLSRFARVAAEREPRAVLRICADNPMILEAGIDRLARTDICDGEDYDYVGFAIDGVPTVLTKQGLWAEWIAASTILTLHEDERLSASDREHVTKFVYENRDGYRVKLIELAELPRAIRKTRLTIDTVEDLAFVKGVILSAGCPYLTSEELATVITNLNAQEEA